MRGLSLIIQREFTSRVKTKAFILTTLFTPVLFLAVIALPTVLMMLSKNDDIKKVYVVDQTDMYFKLLESSKTYEFVRLANKESRPADEQVPTALLQITEDLNMNPAAASFVSEKQQPPKELTNYINNVLTNAVKKKKIENYTIQSEINPQVVTDIQGILNSPDRINVSTVRVDAVTGQEQETLGEMASMVGMVLTFCMFFFIMMYGSVVLQSVVEEKSNRIIEVLISSVKPFDLMMGKIIGVGLVGLLQLAVWLVIGGGAMIAIQMYFGINVDMNSAEAQEAMTMVNAGGMQVPASLAEFYSINWVQVAVSFVLYFVGGYLLFASLFAMFGSGANDSQEAQQLIMPITILLLVAFYTGFAAARNPEGAMAFWCSLIPFTSPVVMMVRAPFEIPLWELALSVVLLFVTAILMVKLAAKIYRVGILMYGKKISFAEMFKWLTYK